MKPQRSLFKWFAILLIFAVTFQSALILPSVSAQGENTPTPTPSTGGLKLTAASYAVQRPFGYPFPGASATLYTSIPVNSRADTIYASLVVTGNAADLYNDEQGDWPDMSMITYIQSMVPSGTLYIDQYWVGIPSVGFAMEDWLPSAALSSYGLPVTPAPYTRTLSYTVNLSTSLGSHMGVGKIWGSKMAVGTPYTLAVYIRYSVVGPGSPVPYDCSATTDTFEPDDTSATGSPITFGEVQRHTLCPQNDQDWVGFQTTDLQPDLLVETFDLEPDSINPNGDTQLTVKDSSQIQIGTNRDRGFAPLSGSIQPVVKSSRVAWHPATDGLFNINIFPETPINEQAGTGYSLHMTDPFLLIDPVDQASWGPTKVNVPTVWRSGGNVIYFSQMFVFEQAELEALTNLNTTVAWEFRRPAVNASTGVEVTNSNVDFGDYWRFLNDVCVGEYWTNLPNPTDEYSEESNLIPGCENKDEPGNFDNEEFEVFVDDPSALIAGKVYWVVVKFYIHSSYLNNGYQFYIAKAEHCKKQSWPIPDEWCNVIQGEKNGANLIEGYLQPAP